MIIDDFYQMLKQCVIDMAYHPPYQINTFTVVDQIPDIKHQSFGSSYEDFISGRFWSRSWVNGGADANELCAEWPSLFVENRTMEQDCLNSDEVGAQLWILAMDKIKCEGCPPNILRTGSAVKDQIRASLRGVLKEFYSFALYEIEGETATYEWMSEGRAQSDERDKVMITDIISLIGTDAIKIGDWGNHTDFRGQYAVINISFCWPLDLSFKYSQPTIQELGNTICPC